MPRYRGVKHKALGYLSVAPTCLSNSYLARRIGRVSAPGHALPGEVVNCCKVKSTLLCQLW